MRAARRTGWVVAGVLGTAGLAAGQVPGAPVAIAPTVPVAAGAAAAPAAAGAAPKNIWSFFMKTPEQKAQCKAHFCNSKIGQFVNNLLLPAAAISGGLIGPCCPGPLTPNADDLKKSATSAQGAAAKIKAEEAQAKAKIAAIEYLATVDCRYYPEAEAGMITGLRAEKNECVRLAAAKALASGCCCTPKVVKALAMSVSCSNKDGFPAEASELVRTYAYVALERCMQKCVTGDPEPPPEQPAPVKQALYETLKPTGSETDLTREILLAGYFAPAAGETVASVYADARRALAKKLVLSPATLARLSGPKNLYDALVPAPTPWPGNGKIAAADLPVMKPPVEPTAEPPAVAPAAMTPSPVARPAKAKAPPPPAGPASWLPPAPSAAPNPAYFPPPPARPQPQKAGLSVYAPNDPQAAGPTPLPPASTDTPAPRSGRGNLFDIFQDARRR